MVLNTKRLINVVIFLVNIHYLCYCSCEFRTTDFYILIWTNLRITLQLTLTSLKNKQKNVFLLFCYTIIDRLHVVVEQEKKDI